MIPLVVKDGPRSEVGNCPYGEGCSWQRPSSDCKPSPFNDLAEVIRARDVVVETSLGYLVASLARLPESEENGVCPPVDIESDCEYEQTDESCWGGKPLAAIVISEVGESASVDIAIHEVEEDGRAANKQRHGLVAAWVGEGLDQSAVGVVHGPQAKEGPRADGLH